jgi:hypothetical protein
VAGDRRWDGHHRGSGPRRCKGQDGGLSSCQDG